MGLVRKELIGAGDAIQIEHKSFHFECRDRHAPRLQCPPAGTTISKAPQ
jgi:hypothetical protein